eukprot:scaffold15695_cov160-Amphora_coffeaeformis.AAC.9
MLPRSYVSGGVWFELTRVCSKTAVLNDQRRIFPISTCVRGIQGIKEDVFLSIPCSVGAHGVHRVMDTPMTATESAKFQKAAETICDIQKGVRNNI